MRARMCVRICAYARACVRLPVFPRMRLCVCACVYYFSRDTVLTNILFYCPCLIRSPPISVIFFRGLLKYFSRNFVSSTLVVINLLQLISSKKSGTLVYMKQCILIILRAPDLAIVFLRFESIGWVTIRRRISFHFDLFPLHLCSM